MKRCFWYILTGCMMLGSVHADEAGVATILTRWDKEQKEWSAAYEFADAKKREELQKLKPDAERYAKSLWIQLKPVINSPKALPGIIWVMKHIPAMTATLDEKELRDVTPYMLNALENYMIEEKGVGQTAYTLSQSSDVRCRRILEAIRERNPNSIDQGLAALGMAISLRETQGLCKDDVRSNNVRLTYLKEAILKCYEEPFGDGRVSDYCNELLYELQHLSARKPAPKFTLQSYDGKEVTIPSGKPTLLIFGVIEDEISLKLIEDADLIQERFGGIEVIPICPIDGAKAKQEIPLLQLSHSVYLDEKKEVFKTYRVAAVPYIYFIDQNGIIRLRGIPDMGFEAMMKKAIESGKATTDAQAASQERPALPGRSNSATKTDAKPPTGRTAPPATPASPDDFNAPALRPLPED